MAYDEIRLIRLDRKRREALVKHLKEILANEPRVLLTFLFGSILRRDVVRDVDVAIHTSPPLRLREVLKLASALELQLKVPIDLVQLCDLGPGFRLKILLHGLPLVIKDKPLYHRLIWASFSELQDFRITLEMARGTSYITYPPGIEENSEDEEAALRRDCCGQRERGPHGQPATAARA